MQTTPDNAPIAPKRQRFWRITIITVIVLGGLFFSAAIIPCMVGARPTADRNACINNLRQIDGAKEQWALETRQQIGAPPDITEIDRYIKAGHPSCPAGGTYTYANVESPPECSIKDHQLPSYKVPNAR